MEPHLRLTADEVKDLYAKKLINARGLVYLYLTASRKKGWKLRGTMANLAAQLGISERQLYRALKDLSALNLIDFTIHGEITIWATDDSTDLENFRNPDDLAKPVINSDNFVINSDNLVRDCDNPVSKKGLETSGGADSSTPSDLYNSLQSLSPSPPATPEREKEDRELYPSKEKEGKGAKGEKEETFEDSQETGEDKSCGVENNSQLPSDQELVKFIEKQNPNVRSPKAYARACLKNDRAYWLQEYRSWQLRKQEADRQWEHYQAYQEYKPEPKVEVNPEQAIANIRKIRELLNGRLKLD